MFWRKKNELVFVFYLIHEYWPHWIKPEPDLDFESGYWYHLFVTEQNPNPVSCNQLWNLDLFSIQVSEFIHCNQKNSINISKVSTFTLLSWSWSNNELEADKTIYLKFHLELVRRCPPSWNQRILIWQWFMISWSWFGFGKSGLNKFTWFCNWFRSS